MSKKIIFLLPQNSKFGLGHMYHNALLNNGQKSIIYYYKQNKIFQWLSKFNFLSDFLLKTIKININEIVDFDPDVIIIMKGDLISRSKLEKLKNKTNASLWNIYTDHPLASLGTKIYKFIPSLRVYDLVYTFSEQLIPVFYQLGSKNVKVLPFGYDPKIHYPITNIEDVYKSEIVYLGQWGYLQEWWLSKLPSKYNLKIFGGGWNNLDKDSNIYHCWKKGYGFGKEMKNAVAGSDIVFNLVRAEHGALHSMKTFELMACGGCVFTNRTPEQEKFFIDGFDIVFFDSVDDLIKKIDYYMQRPEERKKLKINALKTVKKHTYEYRVKILLKELNEV